MHGAFPRQSLSTPFPPIRTDTSSNSGSDTSSQSPPLQRVHRKPVSNNPAIRSSPHTSEWKTSSPHNEWKTSSPSQRNYHAADTVYPNRMRVPTTTTQSLSSSSPLPSPAEKHVRTRRHSQGLAKPTFWNPRIDTEPPLKPLKRGLSKKIRGLLQPNRAHIEEGGSTQQNEQDCQASLQRCRTPDFEQEQNPFHMLRLVFF